jgi:hypothetical protein
MLSRRDSSGQLSRFSCRGPLAEGSRVPNTAQKFAKTGAHITACLMVTHGAINSSRSPCIARDMEKHKRDIGGNANLADSRLRARLPPRDNDDCCAIANVSERSGSQMKLPLRPSACARDRRQ